MSFPERPNGQKTVYFFIQGQFGNNLFQYFAAQIIREIYGYDRVYPTFHINLEFNHVIDDAKFKQITYAHGAGQERPYDLDPRKDILLMGFFQRSEIFTAWRDKIRGLFNIDNNDNISNRIRIGNIVKYQSKHTMHPTAEDLTLHLRAGDFWNPSTSQSQMFSPEGLKAIIATIPHQRLFIVRQAPAADWEREYYAEFDELSPIWINGNLGDDFDFMMRSPKIILSASTMAYMAAFLGQATEVHIPYNTFYGGEEGSGQHLDSFDDAVCTVHRGVGYWMPKTVTATTDVTATDIPANPSQSATDNTQSS